MEASTGVLYVRRGLFPTTYSVRIEIEYDVTLQNGTVFSDDEYVYARITAIGKKYDVSYLCRATYVIVFNIIMYAYNVIIHL